MALPIIVMLYVYVLPESPRWLLRKAQRAPLEQKKLKYRKAFEALKTLRFTELQAARDFFLINYLLKAEDEAQKERNPFVELFTMGRSRRALTASGIIMMLQQFSGVNIIAFYSTNFLVADAHFHPKQAFLVG
jgi:hypothetical protein